jgi:hypothetical protein
MKDASGRTWDRCPMCVGVGCLWCSYSGYVPGPRAPTARKQAAVNFTQLAHRALYEAGMLRG